MCRPFLLPPLLLLLLLLRPPLRLLRVVLPPPQAAVQAAAAAPAAAERAPRFAAPPLATAPALAADRHAGLFAAASLCGAAVARCPTRPPQALAQTCRVACMFVSTSLLASVHSTPAPIPTIEDPQPLPPFTLQAQPTTCAACFSTFLKRSVHAHTVLCPDSTQTSSTPYSPHPVPAAHHAHRWRQLADGIFQIAHLAHGGQINLRGACSEWWGVLDTDVAPAIM